MKVLCTCKHEGQDHLHGKGTRIANLKDKKQSGTCTVCGKEHRVSSKK